MACLFGSSYACYHEGKSSTPSQVTVLSDSFEALKEQFNADTSKPRVLAIFSPTCGGCIYGAKALQHEAQNVPQIGNQTKVLIVLVAMLETDNKREAPKAAQRFGFPGVRHFYDGRKEIGTRLTAEQFPNAIRDALEILPRDHEMRE